MPSRRDYLQSYQFAVQRSITALVAGEADPEETPLRRLTGAAFGSIMLGVLALAAVGIFGIVTGRAGSTWRDGSAIVIERESGAPFVVRDGVLIPVANFTSAALMQQSTATVTVPRAQLADMPRAPMVGIADAPRTLPDRRRLFTGQWSICTANSSTSGRANVTTSLFINGRPPAGRALGTDEALLVKLPGGTTLYLVWQGYRYRINSSSVVLAALAMTGAPQLEVGSAWLNALPQGRPLEPLQQGRRGAPFSGIPDLPDARVGQIVVVTTAGERQYYLIGETRLRPITEVEAAIMLAEPATRLAYDGEAPTPREISASAANAAPRAEPPRPSADRPPEVPPRIARLSRPDAATCAQFDNADHSPTILVSDEPLPGVGIPTELRTQQGVSLADRVVIDGGSGAIVAAVPAPGAPAGTIFLVTDLGVRYAIPNEGVLAMLGYSNVPVVRLPASLVARIPSGPTLDPQAASNAISVAQVQRP